MNPEKAYNLRTDWARSALRSGTSHHRWFSERMRSGCTPLGRTAAGLFRQFGSDDDSVESLRAFGPVVDVAICVDVADVAPPATATDVPDPAVYPLEQPSPAAGSLASQIIAVQEEVYVRATPDLLAKAPTYYVTADMVTVMEVAANAFDESDRMPALPTSGGFVVLARPLRVPDDHGNQLVHALAWTSWGQARTATGWQGTVGEVWSFTSRADTADDMVQTARGQWDSATAWRKDADLLPLYADRFITGGKVGALQEDLDEVAARQFARRWIGERARAQADVNNLDPQWFQRLPDAGQARADRDLSRRRALPGAHPQMVGRTQPYLAAFILLLTQQITTADTVTPPADAVHRARKVRPTRPTQVTVVDVRHRQHAPAADAATSPDGQAGARKPLDHRHLVGSHWRWQPHGPERSLRKRIFVAGYVRGPEDKPLRVTPQVTRL